MGKPGRCPAWERGNKAHLDTLTPLKVIQRGRGWDCTVLGRKEERILQIQ